MQPKAVSHEVALLLLEAAVVRQAVGVAGGADAKGVRSPGFELEEFSLEV